MAQQKRKPRVSPAARPRGRAPLPVQVGTCLDFDAERWTFVTESYEDVLVAIEEALSRAAGRGLPNAPVFVELTHAERNEPMSINVNEVWQVFPKEFVRQPPRGSRLENGHADAG